MPTLCVTPLLARRATAWTRWAMTGVVSLGCSLPAVCMAQAQVAAASFGSSETAPQTRLRLGLTPSTHIVYEPKPYVPPNEFHTRVPQQPSLALEFKSPKKDQGPRSLLRVQLSGDSVLHFRPRGGGMTVTYRSQF